MVTILVLPLFSARSAAIRFLHFRARPVHDDLSRVAPESHQLLSYIVADTEKEIASGKKITVNVFSVTLGVGRDVVAAKRRDKLSAKDVRVLEKETQISKGAKLAVNDVVGSFA